MSDSSPKRLFASSVDGFYGFFSLFGLSGLFGLPGLFSLFGFSGLFSLFSFSGFLVYLVDLVNDNAQRTTVSKTDAAKESHFSTRSCGD